MISRKSNRSLAKIVQIRIIAVISAAALVVTLAVPEAAFARRGERERDDSRNRSYARVDDNGHGRNRGPGNSGRCDIHNYHSNSGRRGRSSDDNSYNYSTYQSRDRSGDDMRRHHDDDRKNNVAVHHDNRNNNRVDCKSGNGRDSNRSGRHDSGRHYDDDSYSSRYDDGSYSGRHYEDDDDDDSYSGRHYGDDSRSSRYYNDGSRSGRR